MDREKMAQQALSLQSKDRGAGAIAGQTRAEGADVRTLLKIGDQQLKRGEHAAALETYDRVGRYYVAQGFVRKALAVHLQVRDLLVRFVPELEPQYAHILPKLAELYEQCGLVSDALAAYDEVATKLLRAERVTDAVTVFEKIVALDPTNPLPHLRLAEALVKAERRDGALRHFATAADILLKLGRRDDALKVLDRLLQVRPDPNFARRTAYLYLERGVGNDGMLALAKLQIAFQGNPRDLDTLALLAHAFEMIGQAPKAIEVQKEMARLAREQGNRDVYQQVLGHLMRVAPDDDAVRALLRGGSSGPGTGTGAGSSASRAHDEEVENLDDAEDIEFEEVHTLGGDGPLSVPASLRGGLDAEAEQYVRQALDEAEALRVDGKPERAIEALRITLEVVPGSAALREQLRDLLLETGDREGALGEMITLASIAIDRREYGQAEAILHEIIALAPGHHRAKEMLEHLGQSARARPPKPPKPPARRSSRAAGAAREGVTAPTAPLGVPNPLHRTASGSKSSASYGSYQPSEHLPSYDLEEIGPGESFADTAELEAVRPLSESAGGVRDTATQAGRTAPDGLPPRAAPSGRALDTQGGGPLGSRVPASEILSGTRGFQGDNSLDAALDEIDFFASRGLYDDALSVLHEQLARYPDHPQLLGRLRDVEEYARRAARDESGTRRSVQLERSQPQPVSAEVTEALEAFEPTPEARDAIGLVADQVDVEAVFAKFKEGVKAQVSETDSATHYDLGVAYREMGLLADAIAEFMVAARDPARACVCHWIVGQIELERGQPEEAIAALTRALEASQRTRDQELALCYELGSLYEARRNLQKALSHFEWVERRDPSYRDVADRVRSLRSVVGSMRPPSGGKLSLDEDFDSVFDDILRGEKLP
ncbi:MAG TPA: tetratricopeptide repeat protein [Polyangiaceae bacterium]|nr:tetratricopeptide repeat protein [Polyangiaceae bacterium]